MWVDGNVAWYLEERAPQDVLRCYTRERSQLESALEQRDYMVQRLSFAGLSPEDKATTGQHFVNAHNAIARHENEIEMCVPDWVQRVLEEVRVLRGLDAFMVLPFLS